MADTTPPTQTVPDSVPLQPHDEVSYQLSMLPSKSQRVIGTVQAMRDDGLVTAAFPQEGWTPMLITDKAERFVRIRTSPDVAAAFAAGRAQAAADIRARLADDRHHPDSIDAVLVERAAKIAERISHSECLNKESNE